MLINFLLVGEIGHLWISSFKRTGYLKSLLGYASKVMYAKFYFIDVLGDANSGSIWDFGLKNVHDKHSDFPMDQTLKPCISSYKHILNLIFDHFNDIWIGRKLILMIYISNKCILRANKDMNDVLGLIDSIVFNTDMIIYHFGDTIKKMAKVIKNDPLYTHFSENHIVYILRNTLERRVKFVVINELTLREIKTKKQHLMSSHESCQLKNYMFENYPKLYSNMKKLSFNCMYRLENETVPSYYTQLTPFSDIMPSKFFQSALQTTHHMQNLVKKSFSNNAKG
jgi:hypothetical protein